MLSCVQISSDGTAPVSRAEAHDVVQNLDVSIVAAPRVRRFLRQAHVPLRQKFLDVYRERKTSARARANILFV